MGDEGAGARPGLQDAPQRERGERLAHGGAPDLEPARELALGRQALAGRERARPDVLGQARRDALVALRLVERGVAGPVSGRDGGENWFSH